MSDWQIMKWTASNTSSEILNEELWRRWRMKSIASR